MSFWSDNRFLVTGGAGFLGSYLVENMKRKGAKYITIPLVDKMDLRVPENCRKAVKDNDVIIHVAGMVGGIGATKANPGRSFYDNAAMGLHMMEEARVAGAKKFVMIGSVCAYPKFIPVPFKEENLWDGPLEETNAPYGLAKKMILAQGQAYRQQYGFNAIHLLMVNLYGPRDNFDANSSHVIPAMIRKMVTAKREGVKEVVLWGDGSPTREFLYVEDAAEGICLATERYDKIDPVNLGSGMEISIEDLATTVAEYVEFTGKIVWDKTKPNGQPRRCLDVSRAQKEFGFKAKTKFSDGLRKTVDWYLSTLK